MAYFGDRPANLAVTREGAHGMVGMQRHQRFQVEQKPQFWGSSNKGSKNARFMLLSSWERAERSYWERVEPENSIVSATRM